MCRMLRVTGEDMVCYVGGAPSYAPTAPRAICMAALKASGAMP